jgi:hypothetical protein
MFMTSRLRCPDRTFPFMPSRLCPLTRAHARIFLFAPPHSCAALHVFLYDLPFTPSHSRPLARLLVRALSRVFSFVPPPRPLIPWLGTNIDLALRILSKDGLGPHAITGPIVASRYDILPQRGGPMPSTQPGTMQLPIPFNMPLMGATPWPHGQSVMDTPQTQQQGPINLNYQAQVTPQHPALTLTQTQPPTCLPPMCTLSESPAPASSSSPSAPPRSHPPHPSFVHSPVSSHSRALVHVLPFVFAFNLDN